MEVLTMTTDSIRPAQAVTAKPQQIEAKPKERSAPAPRVEEQGEQRSDSEAEGKRTLVEA